ncbi:hypothetical protein CALVIDRAFT_601988 [Calocera viscosa TUFC12733]|uniref:RING-CH-type domain-containing protein n=1 Tax=Calocera viscosa (strain TUFC12733) TaxID=1330018 RepID=A0A167HM11_CALVF|nr:hypothetical protein CALVIDRAFT_601988 [Calocera viscosa TUFC12733]
MSGTRRWPHARVPDVADLRTRECWICKEDETFTTRGQRKKDSLSKWIHPCKCTLVAHESCLLEWIARTQQTLDPPPQCPQCNAPFVIATKRTVILRALDWIDAKKGTIVNVLIVTGITSGLLVLSTAYGVHALRMLVGKEMSRYMIGNGPEDWPIEAWINLPLIPFALMITQTARLDPFVLSLPFFVSPYVHALNSLNDPEFHPLGAPVLPSSAHDGLMMAFPPSPQLLIALIPPVKLLYSTLRQGLIRMLMSPSAGGARSGRLGAADIDVGPQIREEFGLRVQVEDENGNQQNWARGLVLNGTTIGAFVTYSLSLPLIASVSGHILRFLANYSPGLRTFLALDSIPQPTPFLFGTGVRVATLGLHLRGPSQLLGTGMDPVWWRNTVGLCLFTVTKDAVELLHAWLRREEKRSRRIVSRNFTGVDLGGLDLIM